MKKNKFWLAAMAVTVSMASCSLEEVMEQPEPQAIGFSSFVGKPTRAVTEIKKDNLGSFNVYGGYATNTDVFNGTVVTSDDNGNTWKYTGTQYWVPGKTYRFAAVGPSYAVSSANFTYDDNDAGHDGRLDFTYTLTDLTASKDLVYAEADRTTASPLVEANYAAVEFTFGHIMSWIKIKFVHAMTNGYKITVSDVKVEGVKTGATFTGNNVSTGTWTEPSTQAYLGASADAVKSPDIFPESVDNNLLDASGEYCMVDFIAIPQTLDASEFTISFKLKVQDSAGNYLLGSDSDGVDFSTILTEGKTWAVNNVYVYTADLTSEVLGLKPITFSVKNVGTWDTNDEIDVPKPATGSN